MGRWPAGKIKLWVGQPVNAPFVTPPISLRLALIVCVISVTGTLVYAVAVQLRMGYETAHAAMIFVAVLYFVLPVLIAHSIAVNRWFSRPLLLIYAFAVAFQVVSHALGQPWTREEKAGVLFLTGIVCAGIFWWLYWTVKMRVYYAMISGRELPTGLDRPVDEILGPGRSEVAVTRMFRRVAPYAEKAVIVIIVLAVLLAFAQMNWSPRG